MKINPLEQILYLYGRYFPLSFGKYRLINLLRFKKPQSTERFCFIDKNLKIKVYLDDEIGWRLYYLDQLNAGQDLVLKNISFKNKTFVDVGANIGYYALLAANRGAKVIAFEPVQELFKEMQENIKINHLNIQPLAYAVYSKNTKLGLNRFKENSNRGTSSVSESSSPLNEVRAVSLDSFLKNPKIDFLKVDVEGKEWEVLVGAKKLIEEYKPDIMCEIWSANFRKCFDWLNGLGYKFFVFEKVKRGKTLSQVDKNYQFEGIKDFLFTKAAQKYRKFIF